MKIKTLALLASIPLLAWSQPDEINLNEKEGAAMSVIQACPPRKVCKVPNTQIPELTAELQAKFPSHNLVVLGKIAEYEKLHPGEFPPGKGTMDLRRRELRALEGLIKEYEAEGDSENAKNLDAWRDYYRAMYRMTEAAEALD